MKRPKQKSRTFFLEIALIWWAAAGVAAAKLPDPPPDALQLRIEVDAASEHPAGSLRRQREAKEKRTLQLHRYSVRADDFRLRLWSKEQGYRIMDPPPAIRTYRGFAEEDPNERVVGVLLPNGTFQAEATTGVKRVWHTRKAVDVSSQVRGEPGSDDGKGRWRGAKITRDPSDGPLSHFPPVREMKRAQVGSDITMRCIEKTGDWESALAWSEWQLSMTDEFYTRDLALSFEASETIVRTDRFYPAQVSGPILKQLSQHWKSEHSGENWDYVNAFLGPSAGLSSVGGPFSYGPPIHEIGHSLSMEHGIFGIDMQNPVNHDKALNHFEKRGWMEKFDTAPLAETPDPVHPSSAPDIVVTGPDQPVRIHVLGNDWDSNNEPIHISFHTEKTVPGGTVRKIEHQEKGGRVMDALGYIPPRNYVGKDVIIYTVQNESGLHQSEVAHVYIIDDRDEETAHWPLDRIERDLTPDAGKHRFHAKTPPGAEVVEGPIGQALQLSDGGHIVFGDSELLPERPKHFKPGYKSKWGWYPLEESVGNHFDPLNMGYTVAFWFRASQFLDAEGEIEMAGRDEREKSAAGTLLEKADTELSTAVGFRILGSPDGLQLYVREFTGQISGGDATKKIVTHPGKLEPGQWHHVAMVIDRRNDTASLYLDGVKADDQIELIEDSWIFAGRGDLRLVSRPGVETAFDDMLVAYRAFSSSEVRELAESGRRELMLP